MCFFIGILIADMFPSLLPPGRAVHVIFLSAFLIIFSLIALKRKKIFYVVLCIAFLMLGYIRYLSTVAPLDNDISHLAGNMSGKTSVQGIVAREPEWAENDYSRYIVFDLKAYRALCDGEEKEVTGKVRILASKPKYIPNIGDELVITGKLYLPTKKTNPSGFDYRRYLGHKNIRSIMSADTLDINSRTGRNNKLSFLVKQKIYDLRRCSEKVLDKYLSPGTAGIVKSVVLGVRSDVPVRLKESLKRTGTMHILAVSGLHVGILSVIFIVILKLLGLPKKVTYIGTMVLIAFFAVFSGGRASTVRAAIMCSFVMAGILSGRRTDILHSIVISAFIILFWGPGQLFQPGFILSYIAVLSIVYVTPSMGIVVNKGNHSYFSGIRAYITEGFLISFAVLVGMLPVIAAYFRIIPLLSPIANMVAVPALFVTIILGGMLLITGQISFLAGITVFLSRILEQVIMGLMKTLGIIERMPGSFVKVASPNLISICIFYIVITAVLFFRRKKTGIVTMVMIVLCALNVFIWNEVLRFPSKKTCVTFFDSGKSDATLIEFKDGGTMLIDCGRGDGENIIEPYLRDRGIRKIDCIVISHFHDDHFGGVPYLISNFNVGTIIESDVAESNDKFYLNDENRCMLLDKNIKRIKVSRGDAIKGFEDADIKVLHPERGGQYDNINNSSVVMKIMIKDGDSLLFCGDIEKKAINEILSCGLALKADIVKAPHHGSFSDEDTALYSEFYDRIACRDIVITNKCDEIGKIRAKKIYADPAYITGEDGAKIIK